MGFLSAIRDRFSSKPAAGKIAGVSTHVIIDQKIDATPSAYPPANIDWTKFEPAGVTDARSPCPMINALCNHHMLPHDGRKITQAMAVNVLTKCLNLDSGTAEAFAKRAVTTNPDKQAHSFDLNHLHMHDVIEHDVSLSRNDTAFGDNHTYDGDRWARYLASYGDAKETTIETASNARYQRVRECKAAHEEAGLNFRYGPVELILSYGETALCLNVLGDPENGKIPIEYLKVLFEQERVPYNEGWRKCPETITQKEMLGMIFRLFLANEHKEEEAEVVGLGAAKFVQNKINSMVPTMCTVM